MKHKMYFSRGDVHFTSHGHIPADWGVPQEVWIKLNILMGTYEYLQTWPAAHDTNEADHESSSPGSGWSLQNIHSYCYKHCYDSFCGTEWNFFESKRKFTFFAQVLPFSPSLFRWFRVIIDVREITQDVPNLMSEQAQTYSSYKNNHTVKAVTGVAPNGTITFVPCLLCNERFDWSTSGQQITMYKSTFIYWPARQRCVEKHRLPIVHDVINS